MRVCVVAGKASNETDDCHARDATPAVNRNANAGVDCDDEECNYKSSKAARTMSQLNIVN